MISYRNIIPLHPVALGSSLNFKIEIDDNISIGIALANSTNDMNAFFFFLRMILLFAIKFSRIDGKKKQKDSVAVEDGNVNVALFPCIQ